MTGTISPLYDLSLIKEQYGGSEELIRKMTELFVTNTPLSISNLKKALSDNDWDTVRALAHKMKPSLEMMGIERLREKVREIERLASAREQLSEIPGMVEQLCHTLEAAISEMKKDFSL